MSQIRAFLAIDLDDDLKPKINKVMREFKQIDAHIKYVDLQNLHFTLKFFGDIDTEGIDLIASKVEKVINDFDSFNIKIKGCGAFPNKNRIKYTIYRCQRMFLRQEYGMNTYVHTKLRNILTHSQQFYHITQISGVINIIRRNFRNAFHRYIF